MYTALYRKWRPKNFNDVVAQEHITTTLKNQIKTDRIGHAYLFCGTRGTGKTSTAKIFARAVNCLNPQDFEPCGVCKTCIDALDDSSLDVIEIDAASNNRVENVRDLIENVRYTPSEGKYKVYIIDEVHMLSGAAFNALLKTIEEPPSHAIFILATTDVQKVPATILSRCQRFDFKRIPADVMIEHLKEILNADGIDSDEDSLRLIARISDGAMRDALSILDQCISFCGEDIKYEDVTTVLGIASDEYLYKLSEFINKNNIDELLKLLNELIQNGKDIVNLIVEVLEHFRNMMIIKMTNGVTDILEMSREKYEMILTSSKDIEINKIMYVIKSLTDSIQDIKWIEHKRLYVEMIFIKLCSPELENSKEALLDRISKLENQLSIVVNGISSGNINIVTEDFPHVHEENPAKTVVQTQMQQKQPKQIIVDNEAVVFCIKNWKKILGEIREKKIIPNSTWSVLDESHVEPRENLIIIKVEDMTWELSLKREMNKIINFLNTNYGIKINILVKTIKQVEEQKDEVEYIINTTKKNFGDVAVEIKEE